MKHLLLATLIAVSFVSCEKEPDILPGDLDSEAVVDASLLEPERFLVSAKYPNPTGDVLQKRVVLAAHGFSASTFEWDEFRTYLNEKNRTDVLLSQVLLGGHGRSYTAFKASSWQDWQSSITTEYEKLVEAGFTNIVLVGSSTGCALILELFDRNYFSDKPKPQAVFLVDPIVIPSDKMLSVVRIAGPALGFVESDMESGEEKYWYRYRPYETLVELNTLINKVRKGLEKGISVESVSLKVFKTIRDGSADPVSAVLIYKGIKASYGKIQVEMIDSDLHVYTRLSLRNSVSDQDRARQQKTFGEIAGV